MLMRDSAPDKSSLGLRHGRQYDTFLQWRAQRRHLGVIQESRRAQNVFGRDLRTLAPELVAAAPAASALQEAGTNKGLQDRLEMAR